LALLPGMGSIYYCTLRVLSPQACSYSELTSETVNPFRRLIELLGWGISPSQGLCIHRKTQHRKDQTHVHLSSRIRTHDPSVRAVRALDLAATEAGLFILKAGNTTMEMICCKDTCLQPLQLAVTIFFGNQ
jgi:hypothetical protein